MEKALVLFELIENNGNVLKKDDAICQEVLACLKTVLNSEKKDRWVSMCLLASVLKYCDLEIFEENALVWYKLTLKISNGIPSTSLLSLSLDNLASIILKSQSCEKVSRELSVKGLEPLLQLITDSSIPQLPSTFNLIISCIKRFPGPCLRFVKPLEKLILQSVNSKDPKVSSAAIHCFPWLPWCGGGGEKHLKHVEQWKHYVLGLLKTIHKVSTDLANSNNSFDVDNNDPFISLLSGDKELIGVARLQYLHKLLQLLNSIIGKATPSVVQVPVTLLVSALCEVANLLQIDFEKEGEFLSEPHTTNITLRKVISSLVKCFETVCIQFSSLLAPFTNAFCKILVNIFSSQVIVSKVSCYDAMTAFVRYLAISPSNTSCFNDLTNFICNDIKVFVKNETETITVEPTKQKGKKKNKQSKMFSKDISSSKQGHHFHSVPKNVIDNTLAALRCLENVIVEVGPLCTQQVMENAISSVLSVCEKIIQQDERIIGQYTIENQLQLFKVLYSMLQLHHPKVQVPVSIILSIFSNVATYGRSSSLALFSNQCLLNFDKVIHNAAPELRESAKVTNFEEQIKDKELEIFEEEIEHRNLTVDNWTQSDETLPGNSPIVNISPTKSQSARLRTNGHHQHRQENEQTERSIKSPNRYSFNKIVTPDMLQQRSNTSSDQASLKNSDDSQVVTSSVSRRNSDSVGTRSIVVEEENTKRQGDVVVVEISEDEDEIEAPAAKRVRSDEDVDFERNGGLKGDGGSGKKLPQSDEQELEDMLNTFCEVDADE